MSKRSPPQSVQGTGLGVGVTIGVGVTVVPPVDVVAVGVGVLSVGNVPPPTHETPLIAKLSMSLTSFPPIIRAMMVTDDPAVKLVGANVPSPVAVTVEPFCGVATFNPST